MMLYPNPADLSSEVSGINAIQNSNGESESPWKVPRLMLIVSVMISSPSSLLVHVGIPVGHCSF